MYIFYINSNCFNVCQTKNDSSKWFLNIDYNLLIPTQFWNYKVDMQSHGFVIKIQFDINYVNSNLCLCKYINFDKQWWYHHPHLYTKDLFYTIISLEVKSRQVHYADPCLCHYQNPKLMSHDSFDKLLESLNFKAFIILFCSVTRSQHNRWGRVIQCNWKYKLHCYCILWACGIFCHLLNFSINCYVLCINKTPYSSLYVMESRW